MDQRARTPLSPAALAIVAAVLHVPAAGAQEAGLPTPEQYAERAAAAERAPLFQSTEPLRITLRTDIEWIRDERNDSVEVEGIATFVDLDGSTVERPVDVRARGNFRRDRSNCNFPPLRLDFPRGEMDGTVLEGQNQLKLVTPCHDGRDEYQRYIYDEYLAYRVYQILTPYSFRTRLVEITYEDIEGDYETRTKIGFLIEEDEQMAERNRATFLELPQLHPGRADAEQAVLAAMFNYMIGNTDWSAAFFHNFEVIRTEDGRYVVVPYDFDFAGVVDARYASVPPQLADRIRRVTQRLYRGFCRPELRQDAVAALFNGKRQEIWDLYQGFALHEEDDIRDRLEYYEEFYEMINDPDEFREQILDECTPMPS